MLASGGMRWGECGSWLLETSHIWTVPLHQPSSEFRLIDHSYAVEYLVPRKCRYMVADVTVRLAYGDVAAFPPHARTMRCTCSIIEALWGRLSARKRSGIMFQVTRLSACILSGCVSNDCYSMLLQRCRPPRSPWKNAAF